MYIYKIIKTNCVVYQGIRNILQKYMLSLVENLTYLLIISNINGCHGYLCLYLSCLYLSKHEQNNSFQIIACQIKVIAFKMFYSTF